VSVPFGTPCILTKDSKVSAVHRTHILLEINVVLPLNQLSTFYNKVCIEEVKKIIVKLLGINNCPTVFFVKLSFILIVRLKCIVLKKNEI